MPMARSTSHTHAPVSLRTWPNISKTVHAPRATPRAGASASPKACRPPSAAPDSMTNAAQHTTGAHIAHVGLRPRLYDPSEVAWQRRQRGRGPEVTRAFVQRGIEHTQQTPLLRECGGAGTASFQVGLKSESTGVVQLPIEVGGDVLSVGKYLSPKLYVGYGVSLLGTGQVLTLKYLLRKGFDIQIESSTVENRASVNYRKEK